ncbi:MAG TPA: cellulase family glycosylhydrolase [Oligoflexia bacterium]|nr:cellulase family glycosylhydrolase [Oligoflexia bacterium]
MICHIEKGLAQPARCVKGVNTVSGLKSIDIDDLKTRLGAKTIRYCIEIGGGVDQMSEAQYLLAFNQMVDQFESELLPGLVANGIKAILCLGSPPGGFVDRSSRLPQHRIFSAPWAQNTLKSIWEMLAVRFKDHPNIVAFQLVSEPAVGSFIPVGLQGWYDLQAELVNIVRSRVANKPIIVTSEYSQATRLSRIKLPADSGQIWYAVHFYNPYKFLKQGIESRPYKIAYPSSSANLNMVLKSISRITAFARKKRAQIVITEFSTTRFAPKNSGLNYLQDVLALFKKNKFGWIYHAWRESDYWSLELPAREDKPNASFTKRATTIKKYLRGSGC